VASDVDSGMTKSDVESRLAELVTEKPLPEGPATSPSRVQMDEQDDRLPPRSGPSTEQPKALSTKQLEAPSDRPVTPLDITDRGKGPMAPSTMRRGNVQDEEAPPSSNDEVEEIQGHPHDGRQHIYVMHQRGEH